MKDEIRFPRARRQDLLIEELAGELLIYDVAKSKAHCLNQSAAAIWKHCDGARSIADLARHLCAGLAQGDGEQLVRLGLERLRRRGLLEDAQPFEGVDLSRRMLIRKLAVAAAAVGIIAPLISTVIAPTPANAASCFPSGAPCISPAACCSRACLAGFCT